MNPTLYNIVKAIAGTMITVLNDKNSEHNATNKNILAGLHTALNIIYFYVTGEDPEIGIKPTKVFDWVCALKDPAVNANETPKSNLAVLPN